MIPLKLENLLEGRDFMQVTIKMHECFELDHFATKSLLDSSDGVKTDGGIIGGLSGGLNGGRNGSNKTAFVNMLKNEPAITVSD